MATDQIGPVGGNTLEERTRKVTNLGLSITNLLWKLPPEQFERLCALTREELAAWMEHPVRNSIEIITRKNQVTYRFRIGDVEYECIPFPTTDTSSKIKHSPYDQMGGGNEADAQHLLQHQEQIPHLLNDRQLFFPEWTSAEGSRIHSLVRDDMVWSSTTTDVDLRVYDNYLLVRGGSQ